MSKSLSDSEAKSKPPDPSHELKIKGRRFTLFPGISLFLEARFFILAASFLGFYLFAGEVASEWVYLMASSIFAALTCGLILPFLQILDTKATLSFPGETVVDEKVTVKIVVTHVLLPPILAVLFPIQQLILKVNFRKLNGQKINNCIDPCAAEQIGSKAIISAKSQSLGRGIYQFDSLEAASCFPFALAWWLARIPAQVESQSLSTEKGQLMVYPRTIKMRGRFLKTIGASGTTIGQLEERSMSSQESCSVRGLREYRRGDSPRWVHWRSSARLGRLLVKEFDATSSPQYFVGLDPQSYWQSEEQFELAVCLANSIINNQSKTLKFELLVPPSDTLKEAYGLPPGPQRSREILLRVQPEREFAAASGSDYSEAHCRQRFVTIFNKTLNSHPGCVVLAVLPGSSRSTVNLTEINFEMPQQTGPKTKIDARFVTHHLKRTQQSTNFQHHHHLTTRQFTANKLRGGMSLAKSIGANSQILARISHTEQISLL